MGETASKIEPSESANQADFTALDTALVRGGPESLLADLVGKLRAERRYHELFDALLLDARRRLGLEIVLTAPLDELPEPVRGQVEQAYLDACREVGALLLDAGELRSAWTFLRPLGDKSLVASGLAKFPVSEDNVEEVIEIALYEAVAPALGFGLVLEHFGTCNAISAFDAAISPRPRAERQEPAAMLVRRLHNELVEGLSTDIARREGTRISERSLPRLMEDREWLFLNNNYHIDTTHLASTIRFARCLDDPTALRLALELTEYGRRLSRQFQFAGDEPWADLYPSHALFFQALLGENVDQALAYFRERAEAAEENEPAAAETYVGLLARLGRPRDAVEAAATLLRTGYRATREAPTLLELSCLAGDYRHALAAARERNDPVSYATALLARAAEGAGGNRPKAATEP